MYEGLALFPTLTCGHLRSVERTACGCLSLHVALLQNRGKVHLSVSGSWLPSKAILNVSEKSIMIFQRLREARSAYLLNAVSKETW